MKINEISRQDREELLELMITTVTYPSEGFLSSGSHYIIVGPFEAKLTPVKGLEHINLEITITKT